MKTIRVIILTLTFAVPCRAQQDSLFDVFPLTVGNKWIYDFKARNIVSGLGGASDSGLSEYEIIGVIPAVGSMKWRFECRRDFWMSGSSPPYPYVEHIRDSTIFLLVEMDEGRHELYTPVFDQFSCYPFKLAGADSSRFFRYAQVDSSGNAVEDIVIPNPDSGQLAYHGTFLAKSDTGIVVATGSQYYFTGWISMSHVLQKFERVFPYPHIQLTQLSLVVRTFFGVAKDSVIGIRNDGAEPVIIYNISVTSDRFTVTAAPTTILSRSEGSISLRFNSSVAETTSCKLVIESNSPTSPDTVALRGEAIDGAQVASSRAIFDFGWVLVGTSRRDSLFLYNRGNAPAVIESVIHRLPNFVIDQVPKTLAPQDSAVVVATFTVMTFQTSTVEDTLYLFSNSTTSPDQIILRASPDNVTISTSSIDFGTVPTDEGHIAVVTLTAYPSTNDPPGISPLDVIRESPASDSPFSLAMSPPQYNLGVWSVHDTIRFAPAAEERYSVDLIYRVLKFGVVAGTDTVHISGMGTIIIRLFKLNQNFPNPFNGKTKIVFEVPHAVFVSLKVYDLLGRLAATLTNEPMKAGKYQALFDGSGLASGVYFYRLQAGEFVQTKRLILLK